MINQSQRLGLTPLLRVDDLHVEVRRRDTGFRPALAGVSFTLARGEALGIVGESGSGKSLTLRSILGLNNRREVIQTQGHFTFDGEVLSQDRLAAYRGKHIGYIPQDTSKALNPVMTVGAQIAESIRHHHQISRGDAWRQAVQALGSVGLPDPGDCAYAFPHALSGGQRQRVLVAIALAGDPEVLLADEPTTALDVTIQAQIVGLLRRLCRDHAMGLIFVSHDLALVSQVCDRIAVLYAGRTVETGYSSDVIHTPQHPYTVALLNALPSHTRRQKRLPYIPGAPPSLGEWPEGCAFRPRCSKAQSTCLSPPPRVTVKAAREHTGLCHFPGRSAHEEHTNA